MKAMRWGIRKEKKNRRELRQDMMKKIENKCLKEKKKNESGWKEKKKKQEE